MAVPDLLEGTVRQVLAQRPEDRCPTAAEVLAELERAAKYQDITV